MKIEKTLIEKSVQYGRKEAQMTLSQIKEKYFPNRELNDLRGVEEKETIFPLNIKRDEDTDDINNPYCKSCGSCGESECCSPFICLKKSILKNKDCKYGEIHLREVKLYYDLGKKLYDLVLEKGNIENVRIVNKIFDDLYEEIYGE